MENNSAVLWPLKSPKPNFNNLTVIEEENERDSFIPKPPPVRKSDIKTIKKTVSAELTE